MAYVFKRCLVLLAWAGCAAAAPGGHSYNRFSGPVSGRVHEVQVAPGPAQHPAHHGYDHLTGRIHPDTARDARLVTVDYVAKPDYHYSYGVEDPRTGNRQAHRESRDGDVVRGEYSLVEPDGSLRLVRYTADPKNGFQATVHKQVHGQDTQAPPPVHYGNSADQEDDSKDY